MSIFFPQIKLPHIITGCATLLLFVLLALIGSFFCTRSNFHFLLVPRGFNSRMANSVGLSPNTKGQDLQSATGTTACAFDTVHRIRPTRTTPSSPTPYRRSGPPDPGPLLFRGVWPGAAWHWQDKGNREREEGGGQWDLDGQWASERWQRVCSRDERETAGRPGRSGLFPFHPQARSQRFRTWRMRAARGKGGRSQEMRGRRAKGKDTQAEDVGGSGRQLGSDKRKNCKNLVAEFWLHL